MKTLNLALVSTKVFFRQCWLPGPTFVMSSRLVHPKAQPTPTPPPKNKSNTKHSKTNCSSKRRFETLLHEASWIYTESSRINTLISHPTLNLLSSLIIASCLWSPWCAQKKVHPNSLPPRIYQVPPATVGETTGKKSSPMARNRDVRRRLPSLFLWGWFLWREMKHWAKTSLHPYLTLHFTWSHLWVLHSKNWK